MLATRTGAEGRLFRLLIGGLILVSAAAQFALVPVMLSIEERRRARYRRTAAISAATLVALLTSAAALAVWRLHQ